jgi:hypothetical protein
MLLIETGVCPQGLDSLRDGEFTYFHLRGSGYELFNLILDLVSDAAEHLLFLVDQSTGGIWVYDIPVQNAEREWEYRAPFLVRITDGDHMAERFFQ